jgi:hypothetical protein
MNNFNSENVISGTYGEVWIDGEYMAESTKCRLEVTIDYEDVRRPRKLMPGKKMTGINGEGEITLNKVSSTVAKKVSDKIKAGQTPSFTIISKLDDPDSLGAERIAAYGCKFEKATLADWESGSLGEENYSFTFEDWEYLDAII